MRRALAFPLMFVVAAAAMADTARIKLPEGFAERAEFLPASGFRGWNKGDFNIGQYSGEYASKNSRLDIRNALWVSNKATNSLRLQDPETGKSATAACRLTKGSLTVDVVTFDPKKLRYDCEVEFESGVGLIMLGQAKGSVAERFMALDLRRGDARMPGLELTVRSIHEYDNSSFSSQSPVGYLLEHGDTTLAAVELTDFEPALYLSRDLTPDERYQVVLVAMTVALLPGDLE